MVHQKVIIRPTVCFSCNKLSKYLLKIIKPLSGYSESYIKNSKHFLGKLSTFNLNINHLMVSFDVVSLFANVSVGYH